MALSGALVISVLVGLAVVLGLCLALVRGLVGLRRAVARDARERAEVRARDLERLGRELGARHDATARLMLDATTRNVDQLDRLRASISETHNANEAAKREELQRQFALISGELRAAMETSKKDQAQTLFASSEAIGKRFIELNERFEHIRKTLERQLSEARKDNAEQLEIMRATVDEKLNHTLEKRLGESFKQVSQRLEAVHRGLGEMQSLAVGVGDLKRVLTNVQTRGAWGEVQLSRLLADMLAPGQYESNVQPNPHSNARVEFAIRLPGQGMAHGLETSRKQGGASDALWLPIDAKFPQEDYVRLLDAQEIGDVAAAETAAKGLERKVRGFAQDIAKKYIVPPHTTDFALMFVPTEGLYAEIIRRPGLVERLQREHRVVVTGPTTLLAMLNSLQLGFRTHALHERSAEVWQVLGAVKTEFHKFSAVLHKVEKKLQSASLEIQHAHRRTRQMHRKLKYVEDPVRDAVPAGEGAMAEWKDVSLTATGSSVSATLKDGSSDGGVCEDLSDYGASDGDWPSSEFADDEFATAFEYAVPKEQTGTFEMVDSEANASALPSKPRKVQSE